MYDAPETRGNGGPTQIEHHHESVVVREEPPWTPEVIRYHALDLAIRATERVFDLGGKDVSRGEVTQYVIDRALRFEGYLTGRDI